MPRTGSLWPIAIFTATLVMRPGPSLAAQERPAPDPAPRPVVGFVTDSLTGRPLPGTMVLLVGDDRGVLTDETGRFVLPDVPPGPQLFSVRQYGYEERLVQLEIGAETRGPLRMPLHPSPAALAGFSVVADNLSLMERRFRRRRSATPVAVRALEQDRLMASASPNALDFVATEAFVRLNPCPGGSAFAQCIMRRGRLMESRVYIDERPAIGGLDELANYRPHELYLVEVYSSGLQIRAYTHAFMDRMARRPMALFPIQWR